jgi:hypothetical protein
MVAAVVILGPAKRSPKGPNVRKSYWPVAVLLFLIALIVPSLASAQAGGGRASARAGAQVKVSTLGIGGDVGVRIASRANVRAGFSLFNYTHTFNNDGITYDGKLNLRSVTASLDLYLAGPLHIGPGILLYNGFKGSATAAVPAGSTFTLGGTTYQSSSASPINGILAVSANKVAPEVLIGFGNLVPRNGRRFTVNLDLGVAFQGSPGSTLLLTGLSCAPPNSSGPTCVNVATNPTVQANILSQQAKLDDNLKILRYYPVLSFGVGYRF